MALSEERKQELLKSYSSDIFDKEDEQKLREKEEREIDVIEAAAERKEKEVSVPPVELTAWQKEVQDLELEGLDTRNPETVVMGGEKRTDEEVGK